MLRSEKGKCEGKVAYESMAKAKKAAFYYKVHGKQGKDKGQHPYYCKQCNGWHLTSRRSIYGQDLS